MKKLCKTLGFIIGLPLLYLFNNSVISMIFFKFRLTGIGVNSKNIADLIIKEGWIATGIGDIIFLIMLSIIFLISRKNIIDRCNFKVLKLRDISCAIMIGIGLSVVGIFIAGILYKVIPEYKNISESIVIDSFSIGKILTLVVIVPIIEEIFFRGIIFGYLKENYNIVIAILVQALVFAIMHLNLVQGIYTFILGIGLAVVYIYSNSIFASILCHVIYNLFGIIVINKLLQINQSFGIVVMLLGICCMAVAIIQLINKYGNRLFN